MDARDDRFDGVAIVRLMSWATAAAVALGLAALASLTATGSQRIGTAIAAFAGREARPPAQLARQADIDSDRRSLNEALRLLASDRDRLMTRVDSIERNLDDITGSIKSQMATRPPPENISAQETSNLEALPAITARTSPAKHSDLPDWLANVPEPWPSPSSAMEFAPGPPPPAPSVRVAALPETQPTGPTVVSRTEFGVDIGSGSDVEEVRMLWTAAKARHGRVFGNLRPIMVRQDRAGFPEYRLVIGPLSNASAAARLCATLGAADTTCSTRPYQGERLIP
jgi:SPOR domain